MQDPTSIPKILAALQEVWEGQPDLSLGQLFGVLGNRGLGWDSTDAEALAVLQQVSQEHPSLVDDTSAPITFTTVEPHLQVTLVDGNVVVRSAAHPGRMPSVWRYASMRRTGPGLPLVVTDVEGVEHRLGIVRHLKLFAPGESRSLAGLLQDSVGGNRWLVALEDGARAVVGSRIRRWVQARRDVDVDTFAWARILQCEAGADMTIAPASGGEPVVLGRVTAVLPLEVQEEA
ncbi:hypothetical protein LA324_11245 [Corynebacterium coyleae]|uniref:hypothetical protein n=1 Tax=Corynebacterium coyleae TaxID=53374 RepID=UPI001CCA325F|nr:hypothetical protein [Corynebacterium coyleae]UBI08876.1 hypothetical protein LA324_11245 [Corynebacterium coyleae]